MFWWGWREGKKNHGTHPLLTLVESKYPTKKKAYENPRIHSSMPPMMLTKIYGFQSIRNMEKNLILFCLKFDYIN